MKKRLADFVRLKTLEAVAQTPRSLSSFRQLPLDVESAVDTILSIMICVAMFIAWQQLERRSFALLLAALFLGYLHGNHGTFRSLMRAYELAVSQDEVLDRTIEEIINELSPLNNTWTEVIMETYERAQTCFEPGQRFGIRGIRRD